MILKNIQLKTNRHNSHQVRSETMDERTECHAVAPGRGHVVDANTRIAFGHATTPQLQCFRSTAFAHCYVNGCVCVYVVSLKIERNRDGAFREDQLVFKYMFCDVNSKKALKIEINFNEKTYMKHAHYSRFPRTQ